MAALLARLRYAAGMTCLDLDDRAGFQDGYTAKLEHGDRPSGKKGVQINPDRIRMSAMGEFWLEALGARLVLMPAAMAEQIGAVKAPPPPPRYWNRRPAA